MKLIRIDGQWKEDVAADLQQTQSSVDDTIESYRKLSQLVADFADEVDSGKITTANQAKILAGKRYAALAGPTN